MKVTKLTIFILLLVSVLFSLLNGCSKGIDEDEEDPEIPTVISGRELTIDTAGEITDIKFNTEWIVVSNPVDIRIYNKEQNLRALLTGHTGTVQTIALSEDRGQDFFIAAGCSDGTIRFWDARKLKEEIKKNTANEVLNFTSQHESYYQDILETHPYSVETLVFPFVGSKLLASGGEEPIIKLWDVKLDISIPPPGEYLRGHMDSITVLTYSSTGSLLASGSLDKQIRIWNPSSGLNTKIFTDHTKEIIALVFFPDERYLVSASSDSKMMLWDIEETGAGSQDPVKELVLKDQKVTALAFWSDRKELLVVGTSSGDIYFSDMTDTPSEVRWSKPLQEHTSSITVLASLAAGGSLISGSGDGKVHVEEQDNILSLFEE